LAAATRPNVGVVDDGCEEVGGDHDAAVPGNAHDGCVVTVVQADEQIG
jgi:hypothetical protein